MFNFFKKGKEDDVKRLAEERQENLHLQQQEYKDKIDKLYFQVRENAEVKAILENFFPQVPTPIYLFNDCYTLFEYTISMDYDIGQEILWSSSAQLRDMKILFESKRYGSWDQSEYEKDFPQGNWEKVQLMRAGLGFPNAYREFSTIINFKNDAFAKMKRLFQSMVTFEKEYDYTFILLRFIQLSAPSFSRDALERQSGIDFVGIESMTLMECLFFYYSHYGKYYEDVITDPAISLFTYYMIESTEKTQ